MKMYESPQPVEKYLNVPLECSCGRTHFAPIKAMNIGPGALNTLPEYVKDFGYHRPYILCDATTYQIAGQRCEALLREAGFEPAVRVLRHMGFDEATLGEIVIHRPDDCDLMIGVGTGSITDMLRYSSFKLGLPCFTVATAAPMDGFSASVGIMNVENLKATMPAHSTELILGDADILAGAPFRMTIAGFGDLIGKLNALNDWRLSVMIHDDHYCKRIDELVSFYVDDILENLDALKKHDPAAIGNIMNALLLTGASISLYGSSRAISGAEHHMSHYWEVLGEQRGKDFAMHGEQVAVATVLALMLIEELRNITPDFNRARKCAYAYDPTAWEAEIRRAYGSAADAIIELEAIAEKNSTEGRLQRIDRIETKWPRLLSLLNNVCPSQQLREILLEVGCPCDPKDIGITPEILKDTFLYCKETRDRYTVYQLAWDLGLMEELSDTVVQRLRDLDRI